MSLCEGVVATAFYSEQNVKLRTMSATIDWELDMMTGGIHRHARQAMGQLRADSDFEMCGIEVRWECKCHIMVVLN